MIIEYEGKKPKLGLNVFIAPTATVIGDVEIKDNASIWYGTVVRGDRSSIVIGRNTNIQDNCTVHTDADSPAVIGDNVTVGHNAVVHGCVIEDRCLIGISAVVLSHAMVKEGTIVAAGSVVIEKQEIGPYHLVAGIPATVKNKFEKQFAEELPPSVKNYLKIAGNHIAIYQDPKLR
jgi:gamma-carbonic anhydrase